MSEITKESRAERAIACHNKAYNCAQSVAFAFLDKVDIDPETLFKVTEGLALEWAAWKELWCYFRSSCFSRLKDQHCRPGKA